MKIKSLATLIALALGVTAANATVTLNTTFGIAFDSSGTVPVPNGSLWIMVVDSNDSNSFAGGFNLNSSLTDASAASSAFANQTLSVGAVIGGDTIFAMGAFDSSTTGTTGVHNAVLSGLSLGTNGLVANRNFAFYWLPGTAYSGGSVTLGTAFQIGGIHDGGTDAGVGYNAMVIPSEGGSTTPGASNTAYEGTLPVSRFQAVQVVPEPTVALLGGLGVLALLRRRRD